MNGQDLALKVRLGSAFLLKANNPKKMKNLKIIVLLIVMIGVAACKTTEKPEDELVIEKNFSVENQLNSSARCFMDIYHGLTYTPAEAVGKQADIDLVLWQYTGTSLNKDSYFRSPLEIHLDATGAGQQLETDLGIDTWTTRNNSIISNSDLTEAQFDAIKNRAELMDFWDQNTHGLVNYTPISDVGGVLLSKVFIFQDKNGKKGFLKVKTITSGTSGSMSVVIKIQK